MWGSFIWVSNGTEDGQGNEEVAGYFKVWRYIRISPYQGSEVDIKKMCSSGNESFSTTTFSSIGNSAISSTKMKDFLDLAN